MDPAAPERDQQEKNTVEGKDTNADAVPPRPEFLIFIAAAGHCQDERSDTDDSEKEGVVKHNQESLGVTCFMAAAWVRALTAPPNAQANRDNP